jgi:hypothetical protein
MRSLLSVADRFPPHICRFAARKSHGTEPMSHSDLAKASGLSRAYVAKLSRRRTWKGIPVNVIDAFTSACGVSLFSPWATIRFLKTSKKMHLRRASAAQRKFIGSLFGTGKV